VSDRLICQVDLLATLAAVVNHELKPGDAEDSVNMLPVLTGDITDESALRQTLLSEGTFKRTRAIRKGLWKLIPLLGSGGFTRPSNLKPKPGDTAGQLYNLADDPGETHNVYTDHPDIVAELTKLLDEYPLVTE
jgi:arylsulfatase A-like enzyme